MDAIKFYTEKGWPFVPVRGKKPAVSWQKFVTTAPTDDDVAEWFLLSGISGLALVIGPALWERAGYLWVLDVEAEHRPAAEAWLDAVAPGWQASVVAETGAGGLHVYFRASGPVQTRRCAWGEVRGRGAVVVLPPSRHPETGRLYRWVSFSQPLALEPGVIPGLEPNGRRPPQPTTPLAEPIPEGRRNSTLARVAGSLRRWGAGEDLIAAVLKTVNIELCDPPLEEPEVEAIARSIGRYEPTLGLTIVDCASEPEPGPRTWLVADLVPEGSVTIIYGDAGVHKTWLAIHMATCLAAGLPWLERPVEPCRVLYIDAELDQKEFLRRAYQVARGLGLERPPGGLFYTKLPGSLADPSIFGLVEEAVSATGAGVVVLDSLTIAFSGLDVERQAVATDLMRRLEGLGTVVAIDHTPKPAPGVPVSAYRPFGSQFKFAVARSVIQVRAEDDVLVLAPVKANFARPTRLAVRPVFGEGSVRFEPAPLPEPATKTAGSHRVYERLIEAGQPLTARDIAAQTGLALGTVYNLLKRLREEGLVAQVGDGRWEAVDLDFTVFYDDN